IEDTRELQCAAPNAVFLCTSEQVDMTRLLRATLRLRPDRIVVGEVPRRWRSSRPAIQSLTGH
ncbi:Type II secretion system protein E domain protein, partial [mine drainage metagenome]